MRISSRAKPGALELDDPSGEHHVEVFKIDRIDGGAIGNAAGDARCHEITLDVAI